jgi:hypothetical protein
MTNRMHAVSAALVATMLVSGGRFAAAQSTQYTLDTRWQPWLGCWQPSEAPAAIGEKVTTVCVAPTNSASAVQVTILEDTVVTMRDTVDASGVARRVDRQGCTGTETGAWSADSRRVFLQTHLTCGAGLARNGNTIVAMTPGGEWLTVQTMTVGAGGGVRAVRYHDASSLKTSPGGFSSAEHLAVIAARANAGAALDVAAVVEAVKRTDTAAVQAWIVARGTKFNLSAKQLVELADAGVPGSVTDVMIGVSYPERFALQSADSPMGDGHGVAVDDGLFNTPYYSPYSYYSPYGYYGYRAYGYNAAPVVILRGSDEPHGKVVNGHGYSQSSGSSSATPSSSTKSSGSSGSGGSSSSSSGSSSGGSSSSSSSGRTAHTRPPV